MKDTRTKETIDRKLVETMRQEIRDKASYIQSVEADERRERERREVAEGRVQKLLDERRVVAVSLLRQKMDLVARVAQLDTLIMALGHDPKLEIGETFALRGSRNGR